MAEHIEDREFTILDTETTGLDPQSGDRIVEVAGIRFQGSRQIATFESLVNPGRKISPAAFAVNRITPEMLAGAPTIQKVMPKLLEFIQGSCLCCYNAVFDLGFLNNELLLLGKGPFEKEPVVDLLRMARRLQPGLQRYALWFVAERLGLQASQEHRAFSDVCLSREVFLRLKAILLAKGITDFDNFLSLFALNAGLFSDARQRKLAQIQQAIDLRAAVRMKYLSSSSAVTEREVLPRQILKDNGRDYLVAYCCLRRQERSFRIDGILHLEIV